MAKVQGGQKLFKTFEISHEFILAKNKWIYQSPFFELSYCGKIKRVAIVVHTPKFGKCREILDKKYEVKCVSKTSGTMQSKFLEASVNIKQPSQSDYVIHCHDVEGEISGSYTLMVKLEIYVPIESHESGAIEMVCQIDQEKELNKLMVQQMDLADSTKVNFTCDGESFEVNKLLLKARSPVFKRILDNPKSKEAEENTINFDDHGKETTEIFCNFLNSFEIAEGLLAVYALDLFRLGEMYEIKPLSDFCIEPICKKIDVNSFVEIASLAHLHNNGKILSAAKKFFWSNTETIKNLEEWKEATTSQPKLALALLEAKGE